MPFVQPADASIGLLPDRFIGQNVIHAADQMPQAVAAERVCSEANDVCRENDRADAEAQMLLAVRTYEP